MDLDVGDSTPKGKHRYVGFSDAPCSSHVLEDVTPDGLPPDEAALFKRNRNRRTRRRLERGMVVGNTSPCFGDLSAAISEAGADLATPAASATKDCTAQTSFID